MSYVIPDIFPASYKWLEQQDPSKLTLDHYKACAQDYIRHSVEQGIPLEQFMPVEQFVQDGDLQTLANVVSNWPLKEGAPPAPTPASLLIAIRSFDATKATTFTQALDATYQRCRKWMEANKLNPDNPNETPKERNARLSAARMRRKRQRDAEVDYTNPEELALVRAVREAKDNVTACRKWIKAEEIKARDAYDAAVAQAKAQRAATVSAAQAWLAPTLEKLSDAERALESYHINK